jgi:hypothetical protein
MIEDLIFGEESWQSFYKSLKNKKQVFISVTLADNNEKVYLPTYKSWMKLKEFCETNDKNISCVSLQFRSHVVNCDISHDTKGVYCINSIVGWMGGLNKKNIVIGTLSDGIVRKQTFSVPELAEGKVSYSSEEDCFKEAIIYNVKKANAKTGTI